MADFTYFPDATTVAPWQVTLDVSQPYTVANYRGFGACVDLATTDGTHVLLQVQGGWITGIIHSTSSLPSATDQWISSSVPTSGWTGSGPFIPFYEFLAVIQAPGATGADAAACLLAGDDSFAGAEGDQQFLGEGGIDTVGFAAATGGVRANLATGLATGQGNDMLGGIENLAGSAFRDRLTGDAGANRLDGAAGNDTVVGGGGADTLIGGEGDDGLVGGRGADEFRFAAHSGHDLVVDFTHADVLAFAADVFVDAADVLAHAAQSGADVLIGAPSGDSVVLRGWTLADLTQADVAVF